MAKWILMKFNRYVVCNLDLFNRGRKRRRRSLIFLPSLSFPEDPKDLIRRFLMVEPNERIGLDDALQHPFFNTVVSDILFYASLVVFMYFSRKTFQKYWILVRNLQIKFNFCAFVSLFWCK